MSVFQHFYTGPPARFTFFHRFGDPIYNFPVLFRYLATMNTKRWTYQKPILPEQMLGIEQLATDINISLPLAQLLVQRGIKTYDEAKYFFRPSLDFLHDPFLMADMQKAVDRLSKAIDDNEKILIYGDYDVDGTTSVSLFYDFLHKYYPNLETYIPDRYGEGYGVSAQGVEYAAANGYTLIVTLDCGIKAADKVLMAKGLGIDFIICDHHRPDETLPEAAAVLDPKRSDCAYPYKELTGCGVGFKLLQAMCVAKGYDDDMLMDSLDFLVVSIAADIVPITGENRVLAYYGLKKLNEQKRISFKALAEVAGLNNELTITNVVFGFAPRINAAGRIAHAKAATDLLLSNDWDKALDFAKKINAHNAERRTVDTGITDEALDMIRDNSEADNLKSTVLYKPDWHKGVVGIVASRCIEHFYRPTIILTSSNGKATGSARSVAGFDVYEAIEACSDLLEQFGGHTFAAGLTLPIENVELFRQRFENIVSQRITADQLVPQIDIDLDLELKNINQKFYNIIKQMAPFGPQNMTPVFVSHGLKVVGNPLIMKEKHIKFDVYQEGSPKFTAIAFGMADYKAQLMNDQPFAMAYNIEENNFRDKTTLQLFVKDLKFE